jgi:hypothetical protein
MTTTGLQAGCLATDLWSSEWVYADFVSSNLGLFGLLSQWQWQRLCVVVVGGGGGRLAALMTTTG